MKIFVYLYILCGIIVKLIATKSVDSSSPLLSCKEMDPQNSLDIDYVQGMWFGDEVITHYDHSELEEIDNKETCVVIHISEVIDPFSSSTTPSSYSYDNNYNNNNNYNNRGREVKPRSLKLVWEEKYTTLEYTLRFNDSRRGIWRSAGSPKQTMLNLPQNQFIGTVQVMKAVGNQLVLTFCQALAQNKLFTIILSRKPYSLLEEELVGIRSLLRRRGLHTSSLKKVCQSNGASKTELSILWILLLLVYKLFN